VIRSESDLVNIVNKTVMTPANFSVFVQATDPSVTKGYETGGIIIQRGNTFRAIQIPNQFLRTLIYIEEFKDGNYSHRNEFQQLLNSAKGVHLTNHSVSLVAGIDSVLPYFSQLTMQRPALQHIESICRSVILPHTYSTGPLSAAYARNKVLKFHMHPNGSGPSDIDLEHSKDSPQVVFPYRTGLVEAQLAVGGRVQKVFVFPRPNSYFAQR
jgi:hypothetical protein